MKYDERACKFNMDTGCVELRLRDGRKISINCTGVEDEITRAIDCIAIENEYGNAPAQRAELDWLLYNKPLEYAQVVLGGGMEHYLLLGCEHGRLED